MEKLEQKHQILTFFFISSTEWVEKTDFGQLITLGNNNPVN